MTFIYILMLVLLTHWSRVTHICVSKRTIIGSDNGLSPSRRQAIIWTNAGILLIGPSGTNFSEILIEIITFSFKKMRLKVSSAKWRPCCLGLNVLNHCEVRHGRVITSHRMQLRIHDLISVKLCLYNRSQIVPFSSDLGDFQSIPK